MPRQIFPKIYRKKTPKNNKRCCKSIFPVYSKQNFCKEDKID